MRCAIGSRFHRILVGAGAAAVVAGLAAPPALAQSQPPEYVRVHETVTTSGGVALDGWVWRPKDAGRVPTVLWYSPYNGNFLDSGGNSEWAGNRPGVPPELAWMTVVPTKRLMEAGYAIAFFSIPGTGNSGGCYDDFGRRTARAGVDLVEWVARQPWSNRKVGMTGQSGDAASIWGVATRAPRALEVIVPMHDIADPYVVHGTPNGLLGWSGAATQYSANYAAHTGPAFNNGVPDGNVSAAARGVSRNRLCPDVVRALQTSTIDPAATVRDRTFWSERRWTDHFPSIRAAVLTKSGFLDTTVGGFGTDAVGWRLLEGDKAMVQAYATHMMPESVGTESWVDIRMRWFDHYLRGVGGRPKEVGRVYYQTDPPPGGPSDGAWSVTTSWPPSDARDEVHHLVAAAGARLVGHLAPAGKLSPKPAARSVRLRAQTRAGDNYALNLDPTPCGAPAGSILFESPAAELDTTIAGVPFAYLKLSSDQDGGQIGVHVFELDREFSCQANPTAARLITWGAADLRFFRGNFTAEKFVDRTFVRVDMETAAARIEADHRVGVVVSGSEPFQRAANAYLPELTLHPGSHVVLPVVGPALGGGGPAIDYPPRPNLPRRGRPGWR